MCHRKISDDTSRLFFRNRFSNQCVQLVRMPAIRNGVRTSFRRLAAGLDSGADLVDDRRQEGNETKRHYQDLEIVLDKRLVSEQVACITENRHPYCPSQGIIGNEPCIMHPAHTGYKRGESPDYRHETGYDYRLPSIFPVKLVSLLQIALLEYFRIRITEKFLSEEMPYHIVAGIPEESRRKDNQHKQMDIERYIRKRSDGTGHEKKGIPWQERRHDKTRLTENDQEQDSISPQMIIMYNLHHIPVDVEDKINYEFKKFHIGKYYRTTRRTLSDPAPQR